MKTKYFCINILLFILLIFLLLFIFRILNPSHIYNGKIKILYEDDYILVIDKPINVALHRTTRWRGPTIVDTLIADGYTLYKNDTDIYQTGVVHRLDVGTSGIIVLAKNEYAYKSLKAQFKYHTVKKTYHALIQGNLEQSSGTINLPIGVINEAQNIYGVVEDGKRSITHYKTLQIFKGLNIIPTVSLVEIILETGRTHQIRVHFSHLNHPLVGDSKYGSNELFDKRIGINHQWLHAKQLEFNHPLTGERLFFDLDYPQDLKDSLEILSKNNNINQLGINYY